MSVHTEGTLKAFYTSESHYNLFMPILE